MNHRIFKLGVLVALGMLTLVVFVLPDREAEAISNDLVVETYYDDPNFINQVGWQIVQRCAGGPGALHGSVGEYAKQETDTCIDPPRTVSVECFIYEWTPCPCSMGGGTCQCIENTWDISCPP